MVSNISPCTVKQQCGIGETKKNPLLYASDGTVLWHTRICSSFQSFVNRGPLPVHVLSRQKRALNKRTISGRATTPGIRS